MAKLPEFKTDEEFAEFVETHDMADYWDEFEEVKDVKIKRPVKKHVSLRIYPYLISEIKEIATVKGMPYQTLIGQWLADRVFQEKKLLAKTSQEA
ncbi:hypothetical protein FJZ31_39075 [Candidatus Poribacteria bacterium]|nr:hypothetical protein [Candidatus Poribacteria bacterium]